MEIGTVTSKARHGESNAHTLQLALVLQEKLKLRTIKRKLTQLEPQGQVDWDVEKLIDRARLTTAAQFYDKDWKDGLTEVGANPEPPLRTPA